MKTGAKRNGEKNGIRDLSEIAMSSKFDTRLSFLWNLTKIAQALLALPISGAI